MIKMVLGTLQYPSRYIGLGEGVYTGLKHLLELDLNNLQPGKYEIDGDNIFFEVREIETVKPEEKYFEAHKNYLYIHITISGEEWFGYSDVKNLEPKNEYDSEKDSAYYSGRGVFLQSPPGHFILFMQNDAHKAGIYFNQQGTVKKILLKVKI